MLTFYLVRGGRVRQTTTVQVGGDDAPAAFNIAVPFDRFCKADTIVVATARHTKWFYHISDFHHAAYLHYGILGYLSSHGCRFADGAYLVNGRPYDGFLHKPAGLRALMYGHPTQSSLIQLQLAVKTNLAY